MAAQQRWGVPAAVTIAQAIEESGWGQSSLAATYHNLFGIKGTGPAGSVLLPTQEFEGGQWISIDAPFRVYHNMAESISDHAQLLATSGYYTRAMGDRSVPDAFANDLTGVYATDPTYGSTLIGLMKLYNLYQYDAAAHPAPAPTSAAPATPSPSSSSPSAAPKATQAPTTPPAPGSTPTSSPASAPAPSPSSTPSSTPTSPAEPTATPGSASPTPAATATAPSAAPGQATIPGLVPVPGSTPTSGHSSTQTASTQAYVRPAPAPAPGVRSRPRANYGPPPGRMAAAAGGAAVASASTMAYVRPTRTAPQRRPQPRLERIYEQELPSGVKTGLFTSARHPLGRAEPMYKDIADQAGISWKLLAACDWMQCQAQPHLSPVHGERLGTLNVDGTVYTTKSAALGQCASDLVELAFAVYGIDLTVPRRMSIQSLAEVFAAFRWGGILRKHGVSAMEFPYSVEGLTDSHVKMRWPAIDEPNAPDRPGTKFRQPFGAVPVVLSLSYRATI